MKRCNFSCVMLFLAGTYYTSANNDEVHHSNHFKGGELRGGGEETPSNIRKGLKDLLSGYPFKEVPHHNQDAIETPAHVVGSGENDHKNRDNDRNDASLAALRKKLIAHHDGVVSSLGSQSENMPLASFNKKLLTHPKMIDQKHLGKKDDLSAVAANNNIEHHDDLVSSLGNQSENVPLASFKEKLRAHHEMLDQNHLEKKDDVSVVAASNNDNKDEAVLQNPANNNDGSTDAPAATKKGPSDNNHDDVKHALYQYFDALQVVLGYVPPPSDETELHTLMAPFVKEVQWSLRVMHPGYDKELVNDDVVVHAMADDYERKSKRHNVNNRRRRELAVDNDACLEKTRDILSVGMRLAYGRDDNNAALGGKDIADEVDVVEAREHLRQLGPLKQSEDEYRLLAREVFKVAQSQIGLDGIINHGMKHWDASNYWATGSLASETWARALQIAVFDTFPIPSQAFHQSPTKSKEEEEGDTITVYEELSALVEDYNTQCATCPLGWTDHGVTNHGLQCTTGFSPTRGTKTLEADCKTAKGKWADVDPEFNPYTCYMSVCPSGWKNKGYHNKKKDGSGGQLMCTMNRRGTSCDESCAQSQCQAVGGTFPLSIDDVADNPYVCYT